MILKVLKTYSKILSHTLKIIPRIIPLLLCWHFQEKSWTESRLFPEHNDGGALPTATASCISPSNNNECRPHFTTSSQIYYLYIYIE